MTEQTNPNRVKCKNNLPVIAAAVLFLAVVIAILLIPGKQDDTKARPWTETSSISEICELATLRSYYHNVVVHEEIPGGAAKVISDILTWPFNQILKTGYKQFWLEYSGIIEAGIDMKADRIRIKSPDENGVIEIYLPEARVLNVDADESSFSAPLDETGLFTSITARERAEAYAAAQDAMRKEAENDQQLMRRATTNARILIEQYIINLGKELGANYTVRWADTPW